MKKKIIEIAADKTYVLRLLTYREFSVICASIGTPIVVSESQLKNDLFIEIYYDM